MTSPVQTRRPRDRQQAVVPAVLGSFLVLSIAGLAALLTRQPLLFPSLGPTAMLFFETPHKAAASVRNTMIGHVVAVVVGYTCLVLAGLTQAPDVTSAGVSVPRLLAAAGSVALTSGVLTLLDARHPPAGATTLIVALGFLTKPAELVAIVAGVGLLTLAAWTANRLLGVRQPVVGGHPD